MLWRFQRAERAKAFSVASDQAELEVPAHPRTGMDAVSDDEELMSDAELLAERKESVAAARAKLARYEPAGRLVRRLKDLPDDARIDVDEASAFLAACTEQAQAADAAHLPDADDEGALLRAA